MSFFWAEWSLGHCVVVYSHSTGLCMTTSFRLFGTDVNTQMWIYTKVKPGQINKCCRCMRADSLFHFLHTGKEKVMKTWVGEDTVEITRWNDITDKTKNLKIPACVSVASELVLHVGKVPVRSTAGTARASDCTYLCVTARSTMALSQVDRALYSSPLLKQPHLFLPSAISSSSHCIHSSVLLFNCSFSPFRRRIMFKPTVTMATFICIWKSEFDGANEMCNNLYRHSASLSKNIKCKLLRHVTQHDGVDTLICRHKFTKNVDKIFVQKFKMNCISHSGPWIATVVVFYNLINVINNMIL